MHSFHLFTYALGAPEVGKRECEGKAQEEKGTTDRVKEGTDISHLSQFFVVTWAFKSLVGAFNILHVRSFYSAKACVSNG